MQAGFASCGEELRSLSCLRCWVCEWFQKQCSMSSQLLVVLLPYSSEVRPSPLGHLSYIPEMLKTVQLGTSALGHHSTPHCVQRRSEYLRSHHGIGQNGAREMRRQQTLVLWVTEISLESRGSEVSHSWRDSYIVTCQLVRS
jgi:hypothetical protein